MKKKTKMSRVVTVVLSLLLLFGLSTTATMASDLPSNEIEGSITVHKYSTASESQTPGTGLELDESVASQLGTPLAGVGFTLYVVDPEFEMLNSTTPEEAKVGATPYPEEFTQNDGKIVWRNLTIGYYVLEETTSPGPGYDKAASAIITLPMGITTTGEGWNYDIHVYPKNVKIDNLTKEVLGTSEIYNVYDTVSWRIDSKITGTLSDGTNFGSYKVSDPLDVRLTFVKDTNTVTAIGGITSPLELQKDVDFEVEVTEGNTVVWTLTNFGITKITDAGSKALSIVFDTTINEKAIDNTEHYDASITNGASTIWTDFEDEETTIDIDPEDQPTIALGGIVIHKIDSRDNQKFLDGAVFKIAASQEDALSGTYIKRSESDEDIVITTGDNPNTPEQDSGWAMIAGLKVDSNNPTSYYLVEIKAPTGYVLRQNVLEITIPVGDKYVTAPIVNQRIGDPPIPEENPTFVLPQTGGSGVLIFMFIGMVLMISAAIFIFFAISRNRRDSEDSKA